VENGLGEEVNATELADELDVAEHFLLGVGPRQLELGFLLVIAVVLGCQRTSVVVVVVAVVHSVADVV